MICRIPPGALRRRAGFTIITGLLAAGLWLFGGHLPARAAVPASSSSASVPPSVDITYKNRNPPHYPIAAFKKGQQGNVVLDITVDATGKVAGVQVDQHGTDASTELQVAAVQAAANWRFNPGRKDAKTIGGVIQVPVNFSLNENYGATHGPNPCPVGDVFLTSKSKCAKLPPSSASSM